MRFVYVFPALVITGWSEYRVITPISHTSLTAFPTACCWNHTLWRAIQLLSNVVDIYTFSNYIDCLDVGYIVSLSVIECSQYSYFCNYINCLDDISVALSNIDLIHTFSYYTSFFLMSGTLCLWVLLCRMSIFNFLNYINSLDEGYIVYLSVVECSRYSQLFDKREFFFFQI